MVDLLIKGIPVSAAEHFVQLQSDFDGHGGFAFKFLCDLHQGILPTGREEVDAKFEVIAEEINTIKDRLIIIEREKTRKEIRTVGGKNIGTVQ